MFGFQGKVLGISIDNPAHELQKRVSDLASETSRMLAHEDVFSPDEILVDDDFLGAGYGIMGDPELEALNLFARREGLLLDPVYTGRAAAGLIELIRSGYFTTDQNVLFWHTGGTPGYATLMMTIPDKETNLVYLTNSADCNVALLPSAIEEALLDN